MKKPIYSFFQYPHQLGGGPLGFGFNINSKLLNIQTELNWRLSDFCRIHQIVYKEILIIDNEISKIPLSEMIPTSFDDLGKIRMREAVNSIDIENDRVTNFVDHMMVVGIWAIAEQFLGKIYREYISIRDSVPSTSVSTPYRWSELIECFNKIGVSLKDCENFNNANECRLVNNAIKHDPTVGPKLSSSSYFAPYTGKDLECVPLELQRYLNGVSDFLGSLIENCNNQLNNRTF